MTAVLNTQVLDADLAPVPGTQLIGFDGVESAASPGGHHVVTIGARGRLVWMDAETLGFKELGTFEGVRSLALGPGGWPVYLGDATGISALAESGEQTRVLEIDSRVMEMAISGDGALLAAACGDRGVRVMRRESGEVLGVLRGHTRSVAALDFSPDNRQLASGGWDDRVLIWDMAALELAPQQALDEAEARWGLTPETALK